MSKTKTKANMKKAGKALAIASRQKAGPDRNKAMAKAMADGMAASPAGKKMKIKVSVNGSKWEGGVNLSESEQISRVAEAMEEHALFSEAIEHTLLSVDGRVGVSFLQRKLSVGYTEAAKIVERMRGCQLLGPDNGLLLTRAMWDHICDEVDKLPAGGGSSGRTTATLSIGGGPDVPMDDVEAAVAGKPSTPEAQSFVKGPQDVLGPGKPVEPKSSGLEAFARKLIDDDIEIEEKINAKFPRGSVTLSIPTDIGKVAAENGGNRFAIGDVAVVSQPSNGRTFLLATNGWMLAVADCQQVVEGPTLVEKIEPQWVPKDFARTDGKDVGVITLKRGHKRGLFDSGLFWVRMREGQPIGKFAAQPTGGNFAPLRDLFRDVDDDMHVAIDAEDLAVIAKAINATGQPGRSVVVLSLSRKQGRQSVMVIGDAGMAVMMPKETNVSEFLHGYRSRLAGVLEAAASPGSVVAKPEKGEASDAGLFNNEKGDDL